MRLLCVLSLFVLSVACGGEKLQKPGSPDDGSEPPNADNQPVNATTENSVSPPSNNSSTNPMPDCCASRQCGVAPGCDTSCGSCNGAEECQAGVCVEPVPGAPQILDLSTNVTTVTPETTVRFSVIVTDPDGISDVIGGTLKSPAGASYGTFQTSSDEGAYALTLTWDEVHAVDALDFDDSLVRVFVAEFFDQGGNTTRAELGLTFQCANPDVEMVCEPGQCADLTTERNCGGCGVDVAVLSDVDCIDGVPTCRGQEEFCHDDNLCSGDRELLACGMCGNDCTTMADDLGVVLDARNFVMCTGGSCRIWLQGPNQESCDAQCGQYDCVEATGYYPNSNTIVERSCSHVWADVEAGQPYGSTTCVCER